MSHVVEVLFNGPTGKLEGKFSKSEEKNAPAVLFLHPHPLHGGTMNNKVIYNSFYSLVDLKFSALRFNFPGVGKSAGQFDHGVNELTSAALALDWLQEAVPEASGYWIIGFSFGSWIAMQLLMRRPEISGFIVIAPPAHSYSFEFLSPCSTQGLFIQGTADKIVPENAVFSLYEKISKQKNSNIEYTAINGAGHFFQDFMPELTSAIIDYIKPRISLNPAPLHLKRDRRKKLNF